MSLFPLLFEIAWKSLLVAGATLAVLRLARDRTAGERSWIAHAGLVVLLALPAAALLLPAWSPSAATFDATGTLAAPIAVGGDTAVPAVVATSELPAAAAPVTGTALTLPSPTVVALWLYLVPLALLAMTMLVAVLRLAALRGRADLMEDAPWLTALARAQRRMGFKNGTALLVSQELRSPISWGLIRPIILLNPAALAESDDAEAIIAHELAHVARLDWAKLLISRAACALLWFNPLVWLLAREAHQLREEAADDAVLMSEVDGTDYATLLVKAARHDNQGLLIAAHGVAPGRDSLKRRIARVLDAGVARRPTSMGWTAAGLVLLAGIAAPLAAFDPFTFQAWSDADTPPAQFAGSTDRAIEYSDSTATSAAVTTAHAERKLSPDELIAMRAVGVTKRDLRAVRTADHAVDPGHAIAARAVGLTPDYVEAMRRVMPEADFEEIFAAKAMGIGPDEVRAMRRAFPGAGLDEMAGARATGVTPDYAASMRKVFPRVDLSDLTGLRALGIDAAYVRSLQRQRGGTVDPDEAIEARALGMPNGVAVDVRRATAAARASAAVAARAAASAAAVAPEPPEPPPAPDDVF